MSAAYLARGCGGDKPSGDDNGKSTLDHLHSPPLTVDTPTDSERLAVSNRRDAFVSLLRSLLPRTQPRLAQKSFGRGGIGSIGCSSLSRRVRPTHAGGREPKVGTPTLRIHRLCPDIARSDLFCRTWWCRKLAFPVSRCPQGCSTGRGRVRGQGCPRTRRGNHHCKHSSTLQTHMLHPSSI